MLFNQDDDYGLMKISNQVVDPIFDDSVYSKNTSELSKKLLVDIKVALNKDIPAKVEKLKTVIKVKLTENKVKSPAATKAADKIVNDIVKIAGRPKVVDVKSKKLSKEISKVASKKADSIVDAKKNTLKLEGKTTKSVSIITKNEQKQIKKEIKKELRKNAGKPSVDSKSISRQISKDAKVIKKEIKKILINEGRDPKSASIIATATANKKKEEVAITRNQKEMVVIKETVKKNLIANGMSPKTASVVVDTKVKPVVQSIVKQTNIQDKSSKSISRDASKDAKHVKEIVKVLVKDLGASPKTASNIAAERELSAKKAIKINMRIDANKPPHTSKSIDKKYKKVVKIIKKNLKEEGKSPKTIKIIINTKMKEIKQNHEQPKVERTSKSVSKSVSKKVDIIVKKIEKKATAKPTKIDIQNKLNPINSDSDSKYRKISKSTSTDSMVKSISPVSSVLPKDNKNGARSDFMPTYNKNNNSGKIKTKILRVKKIMKNIARMIQLNKFDDHSQLFIEPSISNIGSNSHINFNNVINVIQRIKPNKIAHKLSKNDIKSHDGMVIDREKRELIISIVLKSIKDMIKQIIDNPDKNTDYKNLVDKLIKFLNDDKQIMELIKKVAVDKKFMKLLNIDRPESVEKFNNSYTSSIKNKKRAIFDKEQYKKLMKYIQNNLLETFDNKSKSSDENIAVFLKLAFGAFVFWFIYTYVINPKSQLINNSSAINMQTPSVITPFVSTPSMPTPSMPTPSMPSIPMSSLSSMSMPNMSMPPTSMLPPSMAKL